MEGAHPPGSIRLAELMAALSLATDLGIGQPLQHELGVCLAALELADRLGCSTEERADVYYVALVAHVGCTGVAGLFAEWSGGDDIEFQRGAQLLGAVSEPSEDLRHFLRRFAGDRSLPERAWLRGRMLVGGKARFEVMAANLCEGAAILARRLGLPERVEQALAQLTERWDGRGLPGAAAGEQISRPLRIVRVAQDFVAIARAVDRQAAVDALSRRRGKGHDAAVVDAALADPAQLLAVADVPDAWQRVIESEPEPVATIGGGGLDRVADAFGEFTDVKVGFLHGHSRRVGELAATAARAIGCPREEIVQLRRAGFVHDIGRVAVPNHIWEKPAALNAGERERVRLHPYYTERVLEHASALAGLAPLAGAHHERLDGSGYHRGSKAPGITLGARLLAVADAYDAMTHDRPYRAALSPGEARAQLAHMVSCGAFEKRAVDAVLESVGALPVDVRQGYPAGLSEREVEVLRLVAQGKSSKEIARALTITEKTAGHHVEHIYAKLGVSTRVGAALFAMEHDLVEDRRERK
jgi:HD-GYP domain-containing protein (c-di-GMP phosphodiesterase class II)